MKAYIIHNARAVTATGIKLCDLLIDEGRIADMKPALKADCPVLDVHSALLLPGFVDIHTHGCRGIDVNHASAEDFLTLTKEYASFGVTSFLPTILSDAPDRTLTLLHEAARTAREPSRGARILGIHLEGPFLSPAYKGAMPQPFLRLPEPELFDAYYDASQGLLKRITLAPELKGSCALISHAVHKKVSVSLGHSGASYEETMAAIEAGASSCTHTFNGMSLFHQHRPGIMGAVLESDIYCEAICDGLHLHPGAVRLLLKTKGYGRVIAVTDSIMAAGMPDGKYRLGVNDVVVTNGDAQLLDGSSRAGSTLTMLGALKKLLKFTGCSLSEASRLLSGNPAALLGADNTIGSISPGKAADFLLLDDSLTLLGTYCAGQCIYRPTTVTGERRNK